MIEHIEPTLRAAIESWSKTLRLISLLVAATPLAALIALVVLVTRA
jgi:hypothetical protein